MTTLEITAKLDAAAHAICRMRILDPNRRVSETDKRTHFEKARMEAIQFQQLYIAARDAGLLE